jgi:hypothetical protein
MVQSCTCTSTRVFQVFGVEVFLVRAPGIMSEKTKKAQNTTTSFINRRLLPNKRQLELFSVFLMFRTECVESVDMSRLSPMTAVYQAPLYSGPLVDDLCDWPVSVEQDCLRAKLLEFQQCNPWNDLHCLGLVIHVIFSRSPTI